MVFLDERKPNFTLFCRTVHMYTQDSTCNFLTLTVKVTTVPVKVMTFTVDITGIKFPITKGGGGGV